MKTWATTCSTTSSTTSGPWCEAGGDELSATDDNGSAEVHRDLAAWMNAVIAELAAAGVDEFDETLHGIFSRFGPIIDVSVIGESTATDEGVGWRDESKLSSDERAEMGRLLRSLPDADGPFSVAAGGNRVIVAAPAPSNGFSRFTAVGVDRDTPLSPESIRALDLLSSVVGAARQRVMAERELRAGVDRQTFLSNISNRAATDVAYGDTLTEILLEARDYLGVTAASTLIRDGDEFVLIATTDYLGSQPLAPGYRSSDGIVEGLQANGPGHVICDMNSYLAGADALLSTFGEVLCVPRFGPQGVEGIVVFTDAEGRDWSPGEIVVAKSVARSVQKLTARAETERTHRFRRQLDRLLSDVASIAATATLDNLDSVVAETLRMAIECFGLRSAAVWATGAGGSVRVMGRWSDGRVSRKPVVVPNSVDSTRIRDRGYELIRVADIDSEMFTDVDSTALVVAIGPAPSGLITFVHPDHWWSAEELAACRTLANLADQTRARLHADMLMRARLRDQALTGTVAELSVDVDLHNVDDRLHEILEIVRRHCGVSEASIWRWEDGALVCRWSVRESGDPVPERSVMVAADLEPLRRRGWALVDPGAFAHSAHDHHDPPGTRILLVSYEGTDGIEGLIALTDPSRRWWDDQTIATIRAVADNIGQVRMRMVVARRLARQQAVEDILADASSCFVNATLDDASKEIQIQLDRMRECLGLAAITLLSFDHHRLTMECASEVTDDGMRLLEGHFPIERDDPTVARLLDPAQPDMWRLRDLFDFSALDGFSAVALPAVRGRDVMILIASQRSGADLDADTRTALQSLTALFAQLRRRLLLELHGRRRAEADHLLADIARSFVEQPPYDHDEAVEAALGRVGELFGLRALSLWKTPPGRPPIRQLWWGDPALDHGPMEDFGNFTSDHPLMRVLEETGERAAFELGALAPVPEVGSDTLVVQRTLRDAAPVGILVALTPRRQHLIPDLDIQQDVLAALARLVEQLARRAESDVAAARQLLHEDRLRRFATSMVTAEAESSGAVEVSFGLLIESIGIDRATVWHFSPEQSGFSVEGALHVTAAAVEPKDARTAGFVVPADFLDPVRYPHFGGSVSSWNYADAPVGVRRLVHPSPGPEARVVAVLAAPAGGTTNRVRNLTVSRPGSQPFGSDELEFLRSAFSILLQHEARVTAERWFGVAFESAPTGITLREADATLVHCNQAYAEFVGRPVAALVGTDLHEVMPDDMADRRILEFEPPFDSMHQLETAYRRPDGTIRWATVNATPIAVPGRSRPLVLTYVEDVTENRRNREMLEHQATHDELTSLPNRRALVAEIAAELERPGDCAVLVLDLDRFKVVNDSLGHSVGDQLLVTCADRIRLSLRPGDSVCRLGGDEFAILLRAPADQHSAGVVAERLLALLRGPVEIGDDEVYPSASLGVAIPSAGDTVEDLLRHADAAMYQAKGLGRDCWEVFDGSMRQAVADRVRTETDLRRAIDNGQLEVHYQPEYLLETHKIVGTEALVRWRHPERGLLSAGSFIGLAEETGLVVDIGRWVLAEATRQGARWLADGHDLMTRVNLSARQLRGAVVAEVEEALAAAKLPPDRLCLELTETAIMDDVQDSARILAQFRELGVQVAIDDFGTGFSSLAYLKRFPVDILKIDRTFVDGVGVDPDDTAIVRSVVGLARTLRLDVVAEGIEDAAQVGELIGLGCSRGQGFHLARPASAEDISTLLIGGPAISGDSSATE